MIESWKRKRFWKILQDKSVSHTSDFKRAVAYFYSDELKAKIHGKLLKMGCSDESDRHDIIQETIYKFIYKAPKYNPSENHLGYCLQIARNIYLKSKNNAKHMQTVPLEEHDYYINDEVNDDYKMYIHNEINDYIGKLKDDQRVMVNLYLQNEKIPKIIKLVYGVEISTANKGEYHKYKKRVHDAFNKMLNFVRERKNEWNHEMG